MPDTEYLAWLTRVRTAILAQWGAHNVPPRAGMTEVEIAAAWNRLATADISDVWVKTDDGAWGLSAPATSHSVIGQWFPTMMKTRINYSAKDVGISIYDMFSNDDIWNRYVRSYADRHFRRDSFYSYSLVMHRTDAVPTLPGVVPTTAKELLTLVRDNPTRADIGAFDTEGAESFEVWLSPATKDDDYSGYSDKIGSKKDRNIWTVTLDEAHALRDSREFPSHWFRMVPTTLKDSRCIQIRLYSSKTRIFPHGFKSFRVSMCQYAVNFPSLVARALYEEYTKGVEAPVIYDPSAGWGGRLAGAITAKRRGLYVACDPNADHLWTDTQGVLHSKYTEIAAYHASRTPMDEPPRVMFFPVGSETMQDEPAFQELKGKVDVAFTSPPYFNREAYSEDEAQSYKKFSSFDSWCTGFLQPTIATAAAWLKPGGYLLWNIADIKQGGDYLPLEAKSIEYALAQGLILKPTLRLLLVSMPGANRVDETGQGTAKNTCLVNGRLTKYEPIFVFYKPHSPK